MQTLGCCGYSGIRNRTTINLNNVYKDTKYKMSFKKGEAPTFDLNTNF